MGKKHLKEDKYRLGSLSHVYFSMCESAYSMTISIQKNIQNENGEFEKFELEHEQFKYGIKAIVFAAMCVEAAINDYAGWQLGDNYFEKHLSSLDVVSKWIVIPKLVCGHTIDKSGPAHSSLKRLVKDRNSFVHNRSKDFDFSDPDMHLKIEKNEKEFKESTDNAYRALILLTLEMDMVLGEMYNPLKTLNKEFNPTLEIPENLESIVNNCRSIVKKNNS
jgi:hypothetical protein